MSSLYGSGKWGASLYSGTPTYHYVDLGAGSFAVGAAVGGGALARLRNLNGSFAAATAFSGGFTALINLSPATFAVKVDFSAPLELVSEPLWEPDPPCPVDVWTHDPEIQEVAHG